MQTGEMNMRYRIFAGALLLMGTAGTAMAGKADVIAARAEPEGGNMWRFEVTVRHADSGWDHYADAYEIRTPDGKLLGRRVLLHPHVEEQPFTRSLSGVRIPALLGQVRIRAHDKVHGWGGRELTIELPR